MVNKNIANNLFFIIVGFEIGGDILLKYMRSDS